MVFVFLVNSLYSLVIVLSILELSKIFFLVLLLNSIIWYFLKFTMKNYYDILGVSKDSNQEQIKKAYRKLSLQFHPDKNPEGEETFKKLSEAYGVLSDPEKRATFDRGGGINLEDLFGGGGGQADPFEAFSQFFGGGRRQGQPNAPRRARGRDLKVNLKVSLEDVYFGNDKNIKYNKTQGNNTQCPTCRGNGAIQQIRGSAFFKQINNITCPACQGNGFMNGGTVLGSSIKFRVPLACDSGHFLKLKGGGDEVFGGESGDLLVIIEVSDTITQSKEGLDYIYTGTISPLDALLGRKMVVPHFDGPIAITIPPLYDIHKALHAPNKGFRSSTQQFGHMYIHLELEMPKQLNDSEIEALNKLSQSENFKK